MSEYKSPNNRNGKRPTYHNVPVKTSGKSKYNIPKRQKLPTSVIVTNVLMIGVILAICGVVFAIAFNNIKYDKADASKNNSKNAAVVSSSSTLRTQVQSTASTVQSAAVSDTVSSTVDNGLVSSSTEIVESSSSTESSLSTESTTSTSSTEQDPVVPAADFNAEFFNNDLFIGDSIFTGLYLYGYLDHRNVAAAVGYTPYGAQTTVFDENYYSGSAVDYAKKMQPTRIIIMLGSNCLSPQTDFDDFETGYRGLLNTLKTECPNSKILVVSVPPITSDSSLASYSGITNTIINNGNNVIKSLCDELGITYYDVNSVLKDENGYFKADYAEVDGLHFKGTTYPVMLSGIQKILQQ